MRNMADVRLIDAVALITDGRICGNCKDFECCDGNVAFCDNARVRKAINEAPTIKAEPVKCGKWIYGENEDGQDGIFCSECDHFVPWYYDYYDKTDDLINDNPRCPNCGARMDGGKNES